MGNVEVNGMNELQDRLKRLGDGAEKVETKALRKGAQVVADAMKHNVNRSRKRQTHTQDDIKISVKKTDGPIHAEIGPGKATAWRAKFLEFGTTKMAARPFVERSLIENQDKVMQEIANEIKKGLNMS